MEKQEFTDRYVASRELLAHNSDNRIAFIADIKSRLFNQFFHNVNNRFKIDNVVVVTKFETYVIAYNETVEYVLKGTVFYNTEDLLV